MKEIREVARAYYNGADEEEREVARKLFEALDEDGDGKVSLNEYKKRVNPFFSNTHIFEQLDQNGNGTLDFDEVLALYYMDKVSIPRCASCHHLLLASYFCCMSCLGKTTSYHLCCHCYGGGKFDHRHSSSEFSDTRAMLKLLARLMAGDEAAGDGVIDSFKRQASKVIFFYWFHVLGEVQIHTPYLFFSILISPNFQLSRANKPFFSLSFIIVNDFFHFYSLIMV